jgi:predicted nucleotidyltransferase component of viral defense system
MVSSGRNGDLEPSKKGDVMKVLTPLQEDFIGLFAETPLKDTFFLTGGTALSAFYLEHRISEDMDFFTEEEGQVDRVLPLIQGIALRLKGELEVKRSFRSYLEFSMIRGEEVLKCDFAMDSPYRLLEKIFKEEYRIYVDNVQDISCNKLSALYDRNDPKDFVDIYFIDREIIPFEKLVLEAKKKHVGLDNYWLAISLAKIDDVSILPKMLKPISLDDLRQFFKEKSKWLMK